jgi:1-acyl-sn-glycerol-3-phosphate acyltransferase|tara:strand:+ start:2912 stop:3448 length:537 start_codon:yes stop_codon:yes gene_type:complete
MQKIANLIFFKLLKWKILGNPKLPDKCVVIVAPHTHWVDFFVAILIRKVINQQINFIGKKELFKFPLGLFLEMMGGKAVNRGSKSNSVDLIAKIFNNHSIFRLGISPEGTRKKVEYWKTGFYYIAKKAGVPIVSVTLNFRDKNTNFSEPFFPTDNIEKDIKKLKMFFIDIKGMVENFS